MTTDTIARAHQLRRQDPYLSARYALDQVRYRHKDGPPWGDELKDRDHVEFEQDGWEVTIRVEPDDYPDMSYLGEFVEGHRHDSTTRPPGAIKHDRWNNWSPRPSDFPWFVPAISEDEHYRDLRKMGYGKAAARDLAREYVRQSYDAACNFESWIVAVEVSRAGIGLGSAALGGIDDHDWIPDAVMEHDLIGEAITQAEGALSRLCSR